MFCCCCGEGWGLLILGLDFSVVGIILRCGLLLCACTGAKEALNISAVDTAIAEEIGNFIAWALYRKLTAYSVLIIHSIESICSSQALREQPKQKFSTPALMR